MDVGSSHRLELNTLLCCVYSAAHADHAVAGIPAGIPAGIGVPAAA